jgi:hypothetical protein
MHFHAYLALSLRQTRPFLFIDQCLEGIRRLVDATFTGPVNIGSSRRSFATGCPWPPPRAVAHRRLILCRTTAPCAPAMPKFIQATWR